MRVIERRYFAKGVGTTTYAVDAMINKGIIKATREGNIDLDTFSVQSYLKRVKLNADTIFQKYKPELNFSNNSNEFDFSNYDIENMTSQELIETFGVALSKKILDVKKLQKEAFLKELGIQKERGELIEKKKIATVLFSYLDVLNKKVLSLPLYAVDRIIAMALSNEESRRMEISCFLRTSLEKMLVETRDSISEKLV
jgi:hypothetical protein